MNLKQRLDRLEAAHRPQHDWEEAETVKAGLIARLVDLCGGEEALTTLPHQSPEEQAAAYRETLDLLRERLGATEGRSIWSART